jgi:hypothetical protein
MAKETTKEDQALPTLPQQVRDAIEGAAKMLGVAVVELWSIFVRQYVVRGVSELFFALVIVGVSIYLQSYIGLWWLLAAAPSMILFYGAIQYLGNPKYYAIEDITKKIKSFKTDDAIEIVKDKYLRY